MKYISLMYPIIVSLLLSTGCNSNSDSNLTYSSAIAEGRSAVKEVMEETGAASISVALVDGDRVIWSEAFGTADRESGKDATVDTLYSACSISKIIATVAVMILVDQGDVSLDEPVTAYIPAFSMPLDNRYRDITVRMLINHSSGIPEYEPGAVSLSPFPEYSSRMMEGLKAQRLIHTPGTISFYNNDGFTMVENLVKAVTGKSYPDFVRQKILEPLGMSSSQFQNVPLPEGAYAKSYDGDNLRHLYSFNVYASGGLYSTPSELSRIAMMMINRGRYGDTRILSPGSVEAMSHDQRIGSFNPVPYDESRFGLGWDTVAQPALSAVGVKAWQKTGDFSGLYGANMVVAPDEKLGVVVFGSSGSHSTSFASSHAVKISNRILLRALVERGRIPGMPASLSTASLPLKAVTAEEKNTFTGFYASSNGICRLSYGDDDSMTLDVFSSTWAPTYQNFRLRSDGWYASDRDPVTALRLLTRSGRNYIAIRQKGASDHYSCTMMIGQSLEDRPSISDAWEARLDETWLPVNKALDVNFPSKIVNPGFRLKTVNGLTGYLLGNKILADMKPASADRLDGMFLTVPDGMRGMQDVAIENRNAEEWLRAGSYLYRPISGVPVLAEGVITVSIGREGFCEWFRLPPSGSVSIKGSSFWFLYDDDLTELDSGTATGSPVFSGSGVKYLVINGSMGADISLNLSSQ